MRPRTASPDTASPDTTSPDTASPGPGSRASPPTDSARPGPAAGDTWLTIVPWVDPTVDAAGYDPRSAYVEEFWLGTLGPTALLLLRRLVTAFDRYPDGYELDLEVTAAALGLGHRRGSASPFRRAFHRCVMFGLAQQLVGEGYRIRRRVPELPLRHLRRFPPAIQADHARWVAAARGGDEATRRRAG